MLIDRRQAFIGAAATLLSTAFAGRQARAAEIRNALFWNLNMPGHPAATVFGYERIAATIVPDIVRDGDRLIDGASDVVLDMGPNVRFPTVSIDRKETRPIVQVVSAPVAERLRKLLQASPAAALAETATGIEATALLMMEGQHPANPSVGGTIVDHARQVGRPIRQMIADTEVQALYKAPDLAAANAGIGDRQITYLLDLRDKIGPIGTHLEKLYASRQGEEINRLTAEIKSQGIFSTSEFVQTDKMRALMLDRVTGLLNANGDSKPFALLPLGMLTGSDGLLAALTSRGATVSAAA